MRLRPLLVSLALVLTAVACSGSDDDDGALQFDGGDVAGPALDAQPDTVASPDAPPADTGPAPDSAMAAADSSAPDADAGCDPGFGVPVDGTGCVPVADFCSGGAGCVVPVAWDAEEGCLYSLAADGSACEGESADPCVEAFTCRGGSCEDVAPACSDTHRPVVLVHGINGSSADFDVLVERLVGAGWEAGHIYRFDAADPAWGCNVDNAAAIADLVARARAETCAPRVDLVAHSMGTISTRYFIKNLGGAEVVNTYLTLGGMHHGLSSPCLAPDFLGICVWQELCETGAFIAQLDAEPGTPGDLHWVSIYGTADETVPNASSHLEGAENIELDGIAHAGPDGLLEREEAWAEIARVLGYPCW